MVTGASRGIGSEIAQELARTGYTVLALSRGGRGIEDVDLAPDVAQRISALSCDVTDNASIERAVAHAASLGELVGLVNNAGVWMGARSHELTSDDFDTVIATNARGCFEACRAVYPHFKSRGNGTIVNIGSFYDKLGVPGGLAYCASKAAIGAITRCLAVEWARDNIRVMDVAPGFIETDLNASLPDNVRESINARIPGRRFGQVEEVARLVRSLFVDEISFLTGETIYIDGAQGIKE